ncbi:MAG TPA: hypothetical protein VFD28_00710 [Candidatus Eisenbacteria bacterium]|nr:hypothetical protein [Candidatus Eisenbacteria bacterium]
MIKFLYITLLVGFLIIEKIISKEATHRGLILGFIVFCLGFVLNSEMFWLGIIISGVNIARFCIKELRLLKLTSLQDRLAAVVDFETRTN